jgi:hypothetical protein
MRVTSCASHVGLPVAAGGQKESSAQPAGHLEAAVWSALRPCSRSLFLAYIRRHFLLRVDGLCLLEIISDCGAHVLGDAQAALGAEH